MSGCSRPGPPEPQETLKGSNLVQIPPPPEGELQALYFALPAGFCHLEGEAGVPGIECSNLMGAMK